MPECELFGNFGNIVQFILGVTSGAVLVLKRQQEVPRRPWKIWFLDASKQGISAFVAHLFNLVIAIKLSAVEQGDPCLWYFINIMIDTTVGVFFCFLIYSLFERIVLAKGMEIFRTGYYGEEGQMKASYWAAQLAVWLLIVAVVKVLLAVVQYFSADLLVLVASFILRPLFIHPRIELVVVMVLVPFTMNSLQYWIQDNFLKRQKETETGETVQLPMLANDHMAAENSLRMNQL
eukprot:GILI01015251.1.p1 GENE.GILI01015251.1~~GILI01015251.1.p1  ORF type:complete len:234 (+),score=60.69 GILI01015251.1:211-912(+)